MSRRFSNVLKNRQHEEPTVNLTPLIDVVFVILIMFIVVAPLLELDRIELAQAPTSSNDLPITVQETSAISIHVRNDNLILLNNQPVPIDLLTDRLIKARKEYPQVRPQLFHDKKAWFGTYQAVKNALESAGFKEVDVILKPS